MGQVANLSAFRKSATLSEMADNTLPAVGMLAWRAGGARRQTVEKINEQEGSDGFLGCAAECETASDLSSLICRFPDEVAAYYYGSIVNWGDDAHSIAGQNETVNGDAFGRNSDSSRVEDDCEVIGSGNGTCSESFVKNGILKPLQAGFRANAIEQVLQPKEPDTDCCGDTAQFPSLPQSLYGLVLIYLVT